METQTPTQTHLINTRPKELLQSFLQEYNNYQPLDIEKSEQLIKETISYYNGNKDVRNNLVHLQSMENQWYDALNKNEVDYTVYDDEYYFTDLWACWIIYSRAYLRNLVNPNSLVKGESVHSVLTDINSIVDLGCGVGYTTAALKEMFDSAKVYGTNLEDTKQYGFCEFMSKEYDFNVVPDISKINHEVDLVFASEYFEHIINPLEHLQDVIDSISPRYFVIANAFNTRSIGHFDTYENGEDEIDQKDISKIFNKLLIKNGYKKMKTRIWNDRPSVWSKKKEINNES